MDFRRTSLHLIRLVMMTVLAVSATACNEKAAGDASSTAATTTDSGGAGACRLLKTSEVSANLSKAEPGKAETTREKYGITACEWSTEKYRFAAQYWTSEHPSAQEEASGLSLGALDPLKPGVGKNVRYETIQGVGDQAVAVIEKQDAARGILNDFVMLVAQKGNTILVLFAPELADTDRAQALRALQTLGKSAAERL